MAVAIRFSILLLISFALIEMSHAAAVVVCDPAAADQSIAVGPNERVIYTSKNFPMAYPQGVCGVSFYPATPNTKLVLFFESFRSVVINNHFFADTMVFYANDSDGTIGSQPYLNAVKTLEGELDDPQFHYPKTIRGPNYLYSGIIMTKFNATVNLLAPGFTAHVIGYDISKPLVCQGDTISLKAGESYLAVTPGAPFNTEIVTNCNWSVKPADAGTLLRVIANYVELPNGQVSISTSGLPTVNLTNADQPTLVFASAGIANQIDFKMSTSGGHIDYENRPVSYSIVIQAFTAQPALSDCPQTGVTFDLVNNGINVMTPFYIQTQSNLTANFYANNQHCSWSATISDPTKYVIVSYVNQRTELEQCCDIISTSLDNGQSWIPYVTDQDYPNQTMLTIKFDSDHIRTDLGAMVELRAVPKFDAKYGDGTPIALPANAAEVNIQTPGFGFAIPSGLDLKWTFTAPTGTWVRFRLTNEGAGEAICLGNIITIYDGASLNGSVLGILNRDYFYGDNDGCRYQNRVYTNFFSTQQYLTVRWQSPSNSFVRPIAGIQLSAAGVTNNDQVLPNFGSTTSSTGSTTNSTGSTTTSSPSSAPLNKGITSIVMLLFCVSVFVSSLL